LDFANNIMNSISGGIQCLKVGLHPPQKQQFWTAEAVLRPQAPRPEFHSVQAWAATGYSETNFNLDAIVLTCEGA